MPTCTGISLKLRGVVAELPLFLLVLLLVLLLLMLLLLRSVLEEVLCIDPVCDEGVRAFDKAMCDE